MSSPRLRIDDFELAAFADHLGQAVERDVCGAFRVVETPVSILLDRHLVRRLGHEPLPQTRETAYYRTIVHRNMNARAPRPLPLFLELVRQGRRK